MLTNWNILSNILAAWYVGDICAGERSASFLPWSHAFGGVLDLHFMLGHGVHINLISQTSSLAKEAAVRARARQRSQVARARCNPLPILEPHTEPTAPSPRT
jgi:long-subunit acyl-CoA synthetase (AMP-forming)